MDELAELRERVALLEKLVLAIIQAMPPGCHTYLRLVKEIASKVDADDVKSYFDEVFLTAFKDNS